MFYCEKCAKKNGWPATIYPSSGNCEICDEYDLCYSTPSFLLAMPQKEDSGVKNDTDADKVMIEQTCCNGSRKGDSMVIVTMSYQGGGEPLQRMDKLQLIKQIRQAFGLGLRESKDIADGLVARQVNAPGIGISFPVPANMDTGKVPTHFDLSWFEKNDIVCKIEGHEPSQGRSLENVNDIFQALIGYFNRKHQFKAVSEVMELYNEYVDSTER
jgi:hypothetical protein